jgi:hypothetical protein
MKDAELSGNSILVSQSTTNFLAKVILICDCLSQIIV